MSKQPDPNIKKEFDAIHSKTDEVLNNKKATKKTLKEAKKKAKSSKKNLKEAFSDLMNLIDLVRSWSSGKYDRVPWKTIVLAMAAIIYFVSPVDAVFDFIPGLGFLDDITVLGFVLSSIRGDIQKFVEWRDELPEKVVE